jgi:TonB family protein
MNTPLLLDNLLAWSVQVLILVTAGSVASLALRHPRARLYFWQGILAAALLLPVLAPWKQPVTVALTFSGMVSSTVQSLPTLPVAPLPRWRVDPLLGALAAGTALRLLWIGVGLLRLRRIRKNARPLEQAPVAFGGIARWYVSDQVRGPVTFGWMRPSILLPASVRELPAEVQEAIASHELFHVHRRDWLFVMAEEFVRSLLWFHPAVWFALAQIQLAREQVVDREVVDATRNRAGYLNALVAVAAKSLQPDVVPAPLFLRKRQLAVRVAALLKETSMSASRLAVHVTAAASLAIAGVFVAVWFFPLQSAAQVVPDDPGITVNAGAALAHRPPVQYPRGITTSGNVLVELKLNSKGEVSDARVLSGPDELRKAVLASVLEWHYVADTAPPALVHATIHFGERSASAAATAAPPPPPPPGAPLGVRGGIGAGKGGGIGAGRGGGIGAGIVGGIGQGVPPPPPPPPPPPAPSTPPPPESAVVQTIYFRGLGTELQQRVQDRLTIRAGDALGRFSRLQDELQQIDEHLTVSWIYDSQRSSVLLYVMLPFPPPPIAAAVPLTPGVYKIGGGMQAPVPIFRPEPEYSEEARKAKWQGGVLLQLTVDENGVPQDIKVIRPLGMGLDQKAIEAVQKWRFKPTLLNGKPVSVSANIEVNFHL